MAIYEYECKKCKHQYTLMCLMSEKDKKQKSKKCPECKSVSKLQILSPVNFNFANPVGCDKYNNSQNYRYYHEHEKEGGVRDQRKFAETNSHMGSDPYPKLDDINNGKSLGKPTDSDGPIRLT